MLPQFQGYRSKTYPGIFKERTQMIEPRRMVPPPNFGSDWKKIGSRRTKMLTVQECSESKSRILIVETNENEESKIVKPQSQSPNPNAQLGLGMTIKS